MSRRPGVRPHCNRLDGRRWLQNSISVWSDVRKTPDEVRLGHPAPFPQMLVERLIETFLPPDGRVVLDPFAGCGSTVLAAQRLGLHGVGLELVAEYAALAAHRLRQAGDATSSIVHHASATTLLSLVPGESVDLCITSPPYWDVLHNGRTADRRSKSARNYRARDGHLGAIADYDGFLDALTGVFTDVLACLRPRAYCCVVVMDLRKGGRFYPLHSDLAARLAAAGYVYDDLIVWNRQAEYNNLRPLGYPTVFRINKVHEYVLLLRKPAGNRP